MSRETLGRKETWSLFIHQVLSRHTEDVEGSESCHIKSTAVVGGKDPKSQGSVISLKIHVTEVDVLRYDSHLSCCPAHNYALCLHHCHYQVSVSPFAPEGEGHLNLSR